MAGMFGFKIIVSRWERALPGVRRPGLTWVNPFTGRLSKVNMRIIASKWNRSARTLLSAGRGRREPGVMWNGTRQPL
jgi:hypothetical protein